MITKKYNLGVLPGFGEIRIEVKINEGVCFLTTNNSYVTRQIYEFAVKNGKKVAFERNYILIEKFDVTPEEYLKKLEIDIATSYKEQKKAREKR